MCQVKEVLSKISGITILLIRLHGGYCRRKLISPEKVWENFFLIRVRLEYKIGNETRKTTQVIYPPDVYRYGRQTLEVVEEAADMRYKKKKSWPCGELINALKKKVILNNEYGLASAENKIWFRNNDFNIIMQHSIGMEGEK